MMIIFSIAMCLCGEDSDYAGKTRYLKMSAEERSAKDREDGHCGMPYDNSYAKDQENAGVGINHKGE